MRWWGLYTQRRPGIDGGKTATLDPQRAGRRVLHAPRPHATAARSTGEQLRTIAGISHGVRPRHRRHHRPAEHPAALDPHRGRPGDLGAARGGRPHDDRGLRRHPARHPRLARWPASPPTRSSTARRPCGRSATATSAAPSSPTCRASSRPRSPARPSLDVAHEVNDVSFVGVVHPELGPGFDVWVGGGLSTNPMFAQRLGAWVSLEEVPEVWVGVVSIFRDHGYRRLRNRARLKFLVADWGAEKFREVLEKEYLGRALLDGPAPALPPDHRRDHVGVHPQSRRPQLGRRRAGRRPGQRRRPRAGRRAGRHATAPAASASPPTRSCSSSTCPTSEVAALETGLAEVGLSSRPTEFRRGVLACTGIEFCKLALVETKARARTVVGELERRLPEFDEPALDPRQRLPELVRPHPGRRHRPQGPGHDRRRRRVGRGVPGPPRRRPGRRAPAGPQDPGAEVARRRRCPTTSSASAAATSSSATDADERFAAWARRADEEATCDEPSRAPPLYCPFCGDEDLRPVEDDDTAPGRAAPARTCSACPWCGSTTPASPRTADRSRQEAGYDHHRVTRRRATSTRSAGSPPRAPPLVGEEGTGAGPDAHTSSGSRPPARPCAGPPRRSGRTSPSPARWATRCSCTWSARPSPAPTCSSSTPATTSPRPSAPATRTRPCCR